MAPQLGKWVPGALCREESMTYHYPDKGTTDEAILAEIQHQLAQLQYGSLEIQVHNGQVVQLERREKKRFVNTEKPK